MIDREKPATALELFIAHYGVKGMRWGERKAKPTASEIRSARIRQGARMRKVRDAEDNLNLVSTGNNKKQIATAVKKYKKAAYDFDTNEDRVTANRMTRGEKAAHVILGGPLALVTLPVNAAINRSIRKDVDKKRQGGPDSIRY